MWRPAMSLKGRTDSSSTRIVRDGARANAIPASKITFILGWGVRRFSATESSACRKGSRSLASSSPDWPSMTLLSSIDAFA